MRPSIFVDSTGFLFFCQALAEIQPALFGRVAHYCSAYSFNFPLSIQCILQFQFLLSLSVMDSSYLG